MEPSGGTLIAGPFDVMDVGRMAVCRDPQGAIFSLWQAGRHIGATYGGPLNQVSWPELATPDPAGAAGFYTHLFGWTTKPQTGVETAQYTEWVNNRESIGGMLPMTGDHWQGVPPHWMVYITVADCDERAAKAQQLGGKVCVPPKDIQNVGRFSVMADPQGAMFAIIQMTAMHQPATT